MKIVVLAVGNTMRRDDGAGVEFGRLADKYNGVETVFCGDAPENALGTVTRLEPDAVIVADAMDFSGSPGEYRWFDSHCLAGNDISTHASLKLVVECIRDFTGASTGVLGFQPSDRGWGAGLSVPVQRAVKLAADELAAYVENYALPGGQHEHGKNSINSR